MDLSACADAASTYRAFEHSMEFPSKDSKNWNALNDMLADLSWAEADGHLILIFGAALFGKARPAEHAELFDVLTSVGEHWHSWRNMAHPFKAVILK